MLLLSGFTLHFMVINLLDQSGHGQTEFHLWAVGFFLSLNQRENADHVCCTVSRRGNNPLFKKVHFLCLLLPIIFIAFFSSSTFIFIMQSALGKNKCLSKEQRTRGTWGESCIVYTLGNYTALISTLYAATFYSWVQNVLFNRDYFTQAIQNSFGIKIHNITSFVWAPSSTWPRFRHYWSAEWDVQASRRGGDLFELEPSKVAISRPGLSKLKSEGRIQSLEKALAMWAEFTVPPLRHMYSISSRTGSTSPVAQSLDLIEIHTKWGWNGKLWSKDHIFS